MDRVLDLINYMFLRQSRVRHVTFFHLLPQEIATVLPPGILSAIIWYAMQGSDQQTTVKYNSFIWHDLMRIWSLNRTCTDYTRSWVLAKSSIRRYPYCMRQKLHSSGTNCQLLSHRHYRVGSSNHDIIVKNAAASCVAPEGFFLDIGIICLWCVVFKALDFFNSIAEILRD